MTSNSLPVYTNGSQNSAFNMAGLRHRMPQSLPKKFKTCKPKILSLDSTKARLHPPQCNSATRDRAWLGACSSLVNTLFLHTLLISVHMNKWGVFFKLRRKQRAAACRCVREQTADQVMAKCHSDEQRLGEVKSLMRKVSTTLPAVSPQKQRGYVSQQEKTWAPFCTAP